VKFYIALEADISNINEYTINLFLLDLQMLCRIVGSGK